MLVKIAMHGVYPSGVLSSASSGWWIYLGDLNSASASFARP